MVTHLIRRPRGAALGLAGTVLLLIALTSACEKIPLLAPSGSVITLFPVTSTVPLGGEVEIVATVIEQGQAAPPPTNGTGGTTPGTTTTGTTGAGTPVHNGTVVSFTTTLGRIEPREARTLNGEVRVRFIAGGQSGIATITAYSGGATGRLENLRVGTAAVERVIVNANPQTLGASGGTAEVSARVEDASGLPVVGVPVTFSTSAGQITPNPATSDQSGLARATLTTTREANVTATVAGVTSEQLTIGLNPRTGISIAPPTTPVSAGQPALFTVNVSEQANIRDVTINWGDGASQSLGALSGSTPVSHIYTDSGNFTVTATATDTSGFSEPVSTVVNVLPAQPPSVVVTPSNNSPTVGETVILRAQVSGNTSSIIRYEWTFGAGAVPATAETTGNQAQASWTTTGTKVITVRVIQATGPTGDGFGTVVVRP